jgi:hypothetical protein
VCSGGFTSDAETEAQHEKRRVTLVGRPTPQRSADVPNTRSTRWKNGPSALLEERPTRAAVGGANATGFPARQAEPAVVAAASSGYGPSRRCGKSLSARLYGREHTSSVGQSPPAVFWIVGALVIIVMAYFSLRRAEGVVERRHAAVRPSLAQSPCQPRHPVLAFELK